MQSNVKRLQINTSEITIFQVMEADKEILEGLVPLPKFFNLSNVVLYQRTNLLISLT